MYISAIHNLHIASGKHHHFANQLTPWLEQVLHGIKREQACTLATRIRLLITIQVMRRIKVHLLKHPYKYHNILMWAVCCTAFFGYFRCSQDYDPKVHLSYADIAVDRRKNPRIVQIQIKQSKTDPFCRSQTLIREN